MTRWLVVPAVGATYLVLVASLAPADLVIALVLGAGIAWWVDADVFGRFRGRVTAFPRLVVGSVAAVAQGTWQVLRILLGLASWRHAGTVEVPRGERTDEGVFVTAMVLSIAPGTAYLGEDPARGVLFFSAVDASDPDAVRADVERFYRRWQRGAVP